MDDFFFNNRKSNENEKLLDEIMEAQKKRENKYNIKSGYLLRKKSEKVNDVSVFKKSELQEEEDKNLLSKNIQSQQPIFIVSDKYKQPRGMAYRNDKNRKHHKKINPKIFLGFFLSLIILTGIIVGVIVGINLNTKSALKISCGYLDGIEIENALGQTVSNVELKKNESFKFKINLTNGYKNSVITVYFNDVVINKDSNGYYNIKNTNHKLNLHISGVRPDTYNINLKYGTKGKFKLKNSINGSTIQTSQTKSVDFNGYYNFIVTIDGVEKINKYSYSVYFNDVLQLPIRENGFFDEYSVKITANSDIVLNCYSPNEIFTFLKQEQENSYRITKIIEPNLEEVNFPLNYNNLPVKLNFPSNSMYNTISKVGLNVNSVNVNYANLDLLPNLQEINTFGSIINDNNYLVSTNGVLFEIKDNIKSCLIVPNSILKNATNKTLNISCDKLLNGSINNLKYAEQLNLNVTDIEPLAFNKYYNDRLYSISFLNSNFKYINSVIYKDVSLDGVTKLALVCVPKFNGEITINENCTEILAHAFTNTEITKINFPTTNIKLNNFCFAGMLELSEISLPNGINEIPQYCFMNCTKLQVVNLTNLNKEIKIYENAFSLFDNIEILKIVVKDELLNSFKELNNSLTLNEKFITESEFNELAV